MEASRERTLRIMQMNVSSGGLGWSYEKAIKYEKNIYDNLRGETYELKVRAFLENSYQVMKLEKQGIYFR